MRKVVAPAKSVLSGNSNARNIQHHLRYHSRFGLPDDLKSYLEGFVSHVSKEGEAYLDNTNNFYRARINAIGQREPFMQEDMGCPGFNEAKAGRINPEGIPYLYLARSYETAVAEVRPWVGASVSVGEFRLSKNIRCASFLPETYIENGNNKGLSKVEIKHNVCAYDAIMGMYFSAPTYEPDKLSYLGSQYISQRFKDLGYDGVLYASALHHGGVNIAIFDPNIGSCLGVSVSRVSNVSYEIFTEKGSR